MNRQPASAPELAELYRVLVASTTSDLAPAWILGSSVNSLSFVRSLGRRGIPCVVIDAEKMIAAHSRYTTFAAVSMAALDSVEGVSSLKDAAMASRSAPVIFATSDGHNHFLARHQDALAPVARYLSPSLQTIESILDKKLQYQRASEAGIATPVCSYPESDEALEDFSRTISYPSIIKPCVSHVGRKLLGGRKVRVVHDREELMTAWKELGEAQNQFMIQEIIPGGDDQLFGYLAFWSRDGEELAWVTKQKLRQNPPIYGDGSLQRSVSCEPVRELSRRLLARFDYRGFVAVEYKKDPRDGEFKLMEINPRTVSGNQLAVSAGVDFPSIGYDYLTDPAYRCEARFRPGVQFVNEEWDLRAYLSLRKEGKLGLSGFLKTLMGSESRAIWAADDMRPMLVTVQSLMRASLEKLRRGL